jgi:DNA-binding response OmpR family regulator
MPHPASTSPLSATATPALQVTTPAVAHLAVVEDEHSLRNDLSEFLASRGFAVSAHRTAEDFYAAFATQPCDLVLLDINLPGDSGLLAAQWLRARSSCGVVMLTALGSSSDQVAGLWAGADAYLTKSTPLEVIEATCRSVLRRIAKGIAAPPAAAVVATVQQGVGAWQLLSGHWLLMTPEGIEIALTHSELVFLQCIMGAAGNPVARKDLLLALGKTDTLSNQRNLENYASRLRRKVQSLCATELPIRTSYNQGYTFAAAASVLEL